MGGGMCVQSYDGPLRECGRCLPGALQDMVQKLTQRAQNPQKAAVDDLAWSVREGFWWKFNFTAVSDDCGLSLEAFNALQQRISNWRYPVLFADVQAVMQELRRQYYWLTDVRVASPKGELDSNWDSPYPLAFGKMPLEEYREWRELELMRSEETVA